MQPESISIELRFIQLSNSALSRATPRGADRAGENTSCSNRVWYSRMTEICNSSREPKWANTPDLLMPVTSASAPIDSPCSPMCVARPRAASTMAALVGWPFWRARSPPLRARGKRVIWPPGWSVLWSGSVDIANEKKNDRSILPQIRRRTTTFGKKANDLHTARVRSMAADHGAEGLVGQDFEQHRMRHPAIDDVHGMHSRLGGIECASYLGQHAAGNRAVGEQRVDLAGRQIGQQIPLLVQHARRVGQQHHFFRPPTSALML